MVARLMRLVRRYAVPAVVDTAVVLLSFWLAWTGRAVTARLDRQAALLYLLAAVVVYCGTNSWFGLYTRLWSYATAEEARVIAGSVLAGTALLSTFDLLLIPSLGHPRVPLSVVLFTGTFVLVGFVVVRYRRRALSGVWRGSSRKSEHGRRSRLLIVGAGEAGQLLALRFLYQKEGDGYELVGFVDDDPAKQGMRVHGLLVWGGREVIPELVMRRGVDTIVIAMYNVDRAAFDEILDICERTSARVKVLPNIFDFIQGSKATAPMRDITAEDLIGRKPVAIDREACRQLLAGKVVLVTGAAGSIGSELCRQVQHFGPECLVMLDHNESGLYDMALELELSGGASSVRCIVGDVTHERKMQGLFERYRPQIIFHAAAYKHVPLMEEHPDEAVRTNVIGTWTVASLACRYGAERFVFISTDKAVRPTSVMGATKLIGEKIVHALGSEASTLCTAVRFGNVLGSRGSVLPTFEKQIEQGGPVTVTHPDMTRYFMTINEAVSLVIQAATLTRGGDLFVLDMGDQVRIQDLALRLIRLRGLRPGVDIPVVYTGVRPGEKLHEELVDDGEELLPTAHPAVWQVRPQGNGGEILPEDVLELGRLAEEHANGQVTSKLWRVVGTSGAVVSAP